MSKRVANPAVVEAQGDAIEELNGKISSVIKFKNKTITTDNHGMAQVTGDGVTADNIISVSTYTDWWGITLTVHTSGGNTAQVIVWNRNTGVPAESGTEVVVRVAYFDPN